VGGKEFFVGWHFFYFFCALAFEMLSVGLVVVAKNGR
jgi:hypothetical protein